jgi:hypothetical protein
MALISSRILSTMAMYRPCVSLSSPAPCFTIDCLQDTAPSVLSRHFMILASCFVAGRVPPRNLMIGVLVVAGCLMTWV